MGNAKRGRGSRHGVYLCAVAALGFALSGCGGGTSGSSSADAAAQSSTTQGTAPAQSTSASTASDSSTSGNSKSGGTTSGSGKSTTTGSTTSGGGKSAGTTGSGSTGSTPPIASVHAVTLNWTPPTENTNDTPLTNLAGYDIHYGRSSASLTHKISISNPGIATYVVSDLPAGKYYFAVAAVNSAGTESPLSSQVSATVN
jgi:Fibronectin type III domain